MIHCHAEVPVEGETGTHRCSFEVGHKGPHLCDSCALEWNDGDEAPKPVVGAQDNSRPMGGTE